jgi:hypothetical protein
MPYAVQATEIAHPTGTCQYPTGCGEAPAYRVSLGRRAWDLCSGHARDVRGAVEADAAQRDPSARADRDRIFAELGLTGDELGLTGELGLLPD